MMKSEPPEVSWNVICVAVCDTMRAFSTWLGWLGLGLGLMRAFSICSALLRAPRTCRCVVPCTVSIQCTCYGMLLCVSTCVICIAATRGTVIVTVVRKRPSCTPTKALKPSGWSS